MKNQTEYRLTKSRGTVSFRRDEETGELVVAFSSARELVGLQTHEMDIPHAEVAVHQAAQENNLNLGNILVIR